MKKSVSPAFGGASKYPSNEYCFIKLTFFVFLKVPRMTQFLPSRCRRHRRIWTNGRGTIQKTIYRRRMRWVIRESISPATTAELRSSSTRTAPMTRITQPTTSSQRNRNQMSTSLTRNTDAMLVNPMEVSGSIVRYTATPRSSWWPGTTSSSSKSKTNWSKNSIKTNKTRASILCSFWIRPPPRSTNAGIPTTRCTKVFLRFTRLQTLDLIK